MPISRRVIRAGNPAAQVGEVVVDGRLSFTGLRPSARIAGDGLQARRGSGRDREQLVLLRGRERLPGLRELVDGLHFERAHRPEEAALARDRVHRKELIDERRDTRLRRTRDDALRDRLERCVLVRIEELGLVCRRRGSSLQPSRPSSGSRGAAASGAPRQPSAAPRSRSRRSAATAEPPGGRCPPSARSESGSRPASHVRWASGP